MTDLLVQTCLVKGRFVHASLDKADTGRQPDGDPWVGLTITLQATVAVVRNLRTDPAALVTLDPIVVKTDQNGDLVALDGQPSVLIVASDDPMIVPSGNWYWIATVTGPGYPTQRIPFVAPANGQFDLVRDPRVPLDLDTALTEWQKAVAQIREMIANFDGTAIAVFDD